MMLSSVTGLPKKPPPVAVITTYCLPSRPSIGHRRRLRGADELERPQFLAGLRVERAEAAVVGRADEDQPSGRRDRAAVAGTSGLLLVRRQALGDPERHAPRELAGVDVDRGQLSPGRLLAHHVRGRRP